MQSRSNGVLTELPEPNYIARGFGTAAVLMLLVLALFATARVIGGRGPGVVSPRQRRAAIARAKRDLMRIEPPVTSAARKTARPQEEQQ